MLRPSRCCSVFALPRRSCGASSRQPPATVCQRARACRRSHLSVRRADSPANGAPDNCTWVRSATTVTADTRRARSCAQACSRPLPPSTRTPPACSSDAHAARSAGAACAYALPSPLSRSNSSTEVSGARARSIQLRLPTRRVAPCTRSRRSIRGSVVSSPIDGASICSRASDTWISPNRRKASRGSACRPLGSPCTDHTPSSPRCRVKASPRRRTSVSAWPGNRPAYIASTTSAWPTRTSPLGPMRSPSRRNNGPRRVHSVCRRSKRIGWPARSLSHAAICCGCCSASGSAWLAAPTSTASATSASALAVIA